MCSPGRWPSSVTLIAVHAASSGGRARANALRSSSSPSVQAQRGGAARAAPRWQARFNRVGYGRVPQEDVSRLEDAAALPHHRSRSARASASAQGDHPPGTSSVSPSWRSFGDEKGGMSALRGGARSPRPAADWQRDRRRSVLKRALASPCAAKPAEDLLGAGEALTSSVLLEEQRAANPKLK
jgi:hypothetical protein